MSIAHLNEAIANPKMRESLVGRLFSKVAVLSNDECWLWRGKAVHSFGYGRIGSGRGKNFKAHQASYALKHGTIPEGVFASCINVTCLLAVIPVTCSLEQKKRTHAI